LATGHLGFHFLYPSVSCDCFGSISPAIPTYLLVAFSIFVVSFLGFATINRIQSIHRDSALQKGHAILSVFGIFVGCLVTTGVYRLVALENKVTSVLIGKPTSDVGYFQGVLQLTNNTESNLRIVGAHATKCEGFLSISEPLDFMVGKTVRIPGVVAGHQAGGFVSGKVGLYLELSGRTRFQSVKWIANASGEK
jgi:hypothetical protein